MTTSLRVLDVGTNRLSRLDALPTFARLNELWVRWRSVRLSV
jgi:hypothetical protein